MIRETIAIAGFFFKNIRIIYQSDLRNITEELKTRPSCEHFLRFAGHMQPCWVHVS